MTLTAFLSEAKGRYHARAAALALVTDPQRPCGWHAPTLSARDVAAFVLFTPRQTYELALRHWRIWLPTGEATGAMPNVRQKYLDALPRGGAFYRRSGETGQAWAKRLAEIRGLGPVKAPFLACLLEPLAGDVDVCIDVWMARHYLRREVRELTRAEMAAVQGVHAAQAREMGWKPFPLQWAIWDYVRTAGSNGAALVVNETDIARDLAGGE